MTIFTKPGASRTAPIRYALAVVTVLVALLLGMLLDPYMLNESPFLLFFGAVILSAWYGGFGPGLFASALATVLAEYFIVEPRFAFAFADAASQLRPLLFFFEGVLISILSEARLRFLRTLGAEREQYATTLASIGDGVVATDAQGRVTFINRVAETLTGWHRDDALQQDATTVLQITHAQTGKLIDSPVTKALSEGTISTIGEQKVLLARDGQAHPIEDSTAPIRNTSGAITGAVLVFRDATERRRVEDQRRLLATAVDLLSASLDYQQTLRRVALLAVPKLAEMCAVDIIGDDQSVSTLATAFLNEMNEPVLATQSPQRFPLDSAAPNTLQRVLQTGKSELVAEMPATIFAAIAQHAQDPQHRAVLEGVGSAGAMIVPLLARGRIVGAISFVSSTARRSYDISDLAVAEQIASRAALAVDNARLYAAEQRSRQRAEHAASHAVKLQSITAALVEALTPAQVADVIVTRGLDATGAVAGTLLLLRDDDSTAEVVRANGYAAGVVDHWRQSYSSIPTPIADVIATGEPVFTRSLEELAEHYLQLHAQRLTDHQAFASLPLVTEHQTVGIMHFGFAAPQPFDAEQQLFLRAVAYQCAQRLERARLYDAERRAHQTAEAAQQRLAFLAEASAVLSSSLDYEQTLSNLARMLVPALADFCTIHMVEDDGAIRQLSVAHPDEDKTRLLWELDRRWPIDPQQTFGLAQIVRTGQSDMRQQVDEAWLHLFMHNDEQLELLRQLTMTSSMAVPLISRGRSIGVLSLMSTTPAHRFNTDELKLVEELARRAAVAVDNARLYQEAQGAIRMRDQFLSIASHELKTPLTSLMGYAELLERRSRQSGAFAERELRALRVISDQSRRLNRLVGALLDLSRIQSGQLSIERFPFDLHRLIERLVEEIQPTLDQHVLECHGCAESLTILGDELRLEQVIQNLVQNAVKYSPAGGTISITLERQDSHAVVSVTDQGIGIPADSLPFLFSRFYRARNVDPQHISGMGIGLYVVKEIVHLHGGTISVNSEENVGSTFTISLPLAEDEGTEELRN